jgi:RHS repeat-associated protein
MRPSLPAAVSTYDTKDNLRTRTSPEGRTTTYTYTTRNQIETVTDATGRVTTRHYDSKGNLTSVDAPLNRVTAFTFDAQGNLVSVTDSANRTTHFTYDSAGRVTRQTLPDGRVIQYSYDTNGSVTSITPPGRPGHQFIYSQSGLEQRYTPPQPMPPVSTTQTIYAHNANGQVTHITRPDGQAITFTYDDTGRLRTQTLPTGQLVYTYDAEGRQKTVSAPGSVVVESDYDEAGRLQGTTWTGPVSGSITRTYDPAGRVATQSVMGGQTIPFAYDDDDIVTSAGSLNLTLHPQTGLITDATLGVVADQRGYTDADEPASYQANVNGTPVFSTTYPLRDNIGRIKQKTETLDGVTTAYDYAYDPAGRLISVKKNGAEVAAYTYDANSNRLTKAASGGTTIYTYDDQDRLLSQGGTTYTYMANGELQSKTVNGQTTQYTYDVLGNLLRVDLPGGDRIDYLVDGENRRIGKKVNGTLVQGFLYQDHLKPIAELGENGALRTQFVYASKENIPGYLIKDGITYRIISDHLGSPRLVIKTTDGTVVQRRDYDEFGNIIVESGAPDLHPFGFAGGLYDRDTKLTRFGARDYDAETGRWTAKDPIGFQAQDTNLYGYVFDDPVNFIDPEGLITIAENLSAINIQGTLRLVQGVGARHLHHLVPKQILKEWAKTLRPALTGVRGAPNRVSLDANFHVWLHASKKGFNFNKQLYDLIKGLDTVTPEAAAKLAVDLTEKAIKVYLGLP